MTIPIGQVVEHEAFVVLLEEPVSVVAGVLVRLDEDAFAIRLAAGGATIGGRLVVTVGSERLAGRVTAIAGDLVSVARTGVHGTDDRACPRVGAEVPLRWRRAAPGDGWRDASDDAVREAMSDGVSVSGVSFDVDADPPTVGERLRIDAGLEPGAAASAILAIVRRVVPMRGGWSVAVEFVDMDEAAFDALTDLTLSHL